MRALTVQPCQLRTWVDEILKEATGARGIVVRPVFDPRVPATVLCDTGTLRELLLLLLENAVPSGSQPAALFVFETDDPHARVLRLELHGVTDTPMPPAAQELAARLGGEAGRQFVGNRTSLAWFTMSFNQGHHQPDRSPSLATTLGNLSILVVEDNEVNQRVAAECLRHLGYPCQIAGNGADAVRMTGKDFFDLILMDIHMPVMDGLTATRAIRSRDAERPPFIAALTAFSLPGDKARCLEAGMNDYLTKPCRMEDLAVLLAKVATANGKPARGRL